MTAYLIRHGQTQGNLERRYIGSTDQSLCSQGRAVLAERRGPAADALYVSPLLRCRETAALLYPGAAMEIVSDLRECDFGSFEMKTYEELKDSPSYQAWLDTGGISAPPGGESKAQVRERVLTAFRSIAERHSPEDRIVLVTHGGVIMALLEALESSHDFYRWQAGNGSGFRCRWQAGILTVDAPWPDQKLSGAQGTGGSSGEPSQTGAM